MSDDSIATDLHEIVYSYRKAQLLYIAAKLEISSILANGSMSSDDISKRTETDPDTLYRVLRALSSFGVYKENPNKYFELTTKGSFLQKDIPGSVWIDVVMRMEEYNWRPWGELLYSVRTGQSSFEKIFGMNLFEYLSDNPEASRTFSDAMGIYTKKQANVVLEDYDFSPFGIIADIGGSNGDLLKQILSKNKHVQGLLFDMPTVIQKIQYESFEPSVRNRLKIAEGDFFDKIPGNCDLYILKKIIHDWDDEYSKRILENCFKACPNGSRILLIESIIDKEDKHFSDNAINDIHMLVQTIGGRERTVDEYFKMLSEVGFEPLTGRISYIEAIKR